MLFFSHHAGITANGAVRLLFLIRNVGFVPKMGSKLLPGIGGSSFSLFWETESPHSRSRNPASGNREARSFSHILGTRFPASENTFSRSF